MCVPFTGTQAWTQSLGYKIVDEWRPWKSNGQIAGFVHFPPAVVFSTVLHPCLNDLLSCTMSLSTGFNSFPLSKMQFAFLFLESDFHGVLSELQIHTGVC